MSVTTIGVVLAVAWTGFVGSVTFSTTQSVVSIETVKVPDAGTTTASGIAPELGAAALTTSEMASVAVSLKEKLPVGV